MTVIDCKQIGGSVYGKPELWAWTGCTLELCRLGRGTSTGICMPCAFVPCACIRACAFQCACEAYTDVYGPTKACTADRRSGRTCMNVNYIIHFNGNR